MSDYRPIEWEELTDDDDNTYCVAVSCYHNDGMPFLYRLRQKVSDNQIVWYDDSDGEVRFHEHAEWSDVEDAKKEIAETDRKAWEAEMSPMNWGVWNEDGTMRHQLNGDDEFEVDEVDGAFECVILSRQRFDSLADAKQYVENQYRVAKGGQ